MYTVKMNEDQARIVCEALDMYSRMGMGQLDVAVEEFLRMNFYDHYYEQPLPSPERPHQTRGQVVRDLVDKVKNLVWGHPPNGSWGIFNEQVPAKCREAYDIYQVLRKAIAERRIAERRIATTEDAKVRDHLRFTVDMKSYMASNPDLPAVSVEWETCDGTR